MGIISHIIVPVKSQEDMRNARKFFTEVLGLHVRDGMDPNGPSLNLDLATDRGHRMPDRALHLLDDRGTFIDLVCFENRPVANVAGIGSGKGISLAFQIKDIEETWGKLKDYPVQVVFEPGSYAEDPEQLGDPVLPGNREPWLGKYYGFFAVDIGRVSEDGEQQVIEVCEMQKPQ